MWTPLSATPIVVTLLWALPADAAAQTCDRSPLLIRGATVWTASGPQPERDVLLRDGRIVSIVAAGSVNQGAIRVLDGRGKTLLPGLVDSHLHFSMPGGLPKADKPRTDTDAITARQLLRSGVTSGRLHLAALDEAVRLKALSADPCQPIPRLQVGGPGLSGALEKDFTGFQGARTIEEGRAKVARFRAAESWSGRISFFRLTTLTSPPPLSQTKSSSFSQPAPALPIPIFEPRRPISSGIPRCWRSTGSRAR